MTMHEQKAQELYDKFVKTLPDSGDISKQDIKDCCLFLIDECLKAAFHGEHEVYSYYLQVKKAIEKL